MAIIIIIINAKATISAKLMPDNKMSRKAFTAVLLTVLLVVLATNHQAAAVQCNRTPSVRYSVNDLNANTREGGHVWQHIAGLTSKPKGATPKDTQDKSPCLIPGVHLKKHGTQLFETGKIHKCARANLAR